jgi:hypothetical protein
MFISFTHKLLSKDLCHQTKNKKAQQPVFPVLGLCVSKPEPGSSSLVQSKDASAIVLIILLLKHLHALI